MWSNEDHECELEVRSNKWERNIVIRTNEGQCGQIDWQSRWFGHSGEKIIDNE